MQTHLEKKKLYTYQTTKPVKTRHVVTPLSVAAKLH